MYATHCMSYTHKTELTWHVIIRQHNYIVINWWCYLSKQCRMSRKILLLLHQVTMMDSMVCDMLFSVSWCMSVHAQCSSICCNYDLIIYIYIYSQENMDSSRSSSVAYFVIYSCSALFNHLLVETVRCINTEATTLQFCYILILLNILNIEKNPKVAIYQKLMPKHQLMMYRW